MKKLIPSLVVAGLLASVGGMAFARSGGQAGSGHHDSIWWTQTHTKAVGPSSHPVQCTTPNARTDYCPVTPAAPVTPDPKP